MVRFIWFDFDVYNILFSHGSSQFTGIISEVHVNYKWMLLRLLYLALRPYARPYWAAMSWQQIYPKIVTFVKWALPRCCSYGDSDQYSERSHKLFQISVYKIRSPFRLIETAFKSLNFTTVYINLYWQIDTFHPVLLEVPS